MRNKITSLALLLLVVCVMSSCLNSDDTEFTTYDDTAVTSVTLGTLKAYRQTKSKVNPEKDSVYTISVTGSSYPVYIDQIKHEIYNVDSLPVGTDLAHVLITVNTKNSGTPVLKSLTSDSISIINNADSLDFTQPREIIVYSQSGMYRQSYTMKLSAHQEYADSFRWSRLADNAMIAAYTSVKAKTFGNNLYLLGATDSGAELKKTEISDGSSWDAVPFPAALSADASIIADSQNLYVLSNETIYTSADGATWTVLPAAGIAQLVGVCENEMYAISTSGDIMVAKDGDLSWTVDKKDSDMKYLPTQSVCSVSGATATNKDVSRIIMVGNRDASVYSADTTAVVWSKIVDRNLIDGQPWAYQMYSENNRLPLPSLSGLSVVSYGGSMIAIGGDGQAACKETGFKQMYYSFDCGITWHNNKLFQLPVDFTAKNATLAVDKDNYIWIIATGSGQVWRGRLNQLGWQKIPVYFDK